MDTTVERTMWCPKRCDLLVMETKPNPYEFKFTLKGVLCYLITLISVYIFLNAPSFVFDNLPFEIPGIFFGILAMASLLIAMRFSQGTTNEYVCPSCKGVVFDIDRFKQVRKGKVTKKSVKKRNTILQLLNDSSELSELQCPSCSKNMNSFEVLYKLEHKGSSGRHRNLPTPSDVLKNIAEELVVESIIGGAKEMEIEGCKSCKSLWLDKTNRMYLGAATILSNKKGLE